MSDARARVNHLLALAMLDAQIGASEAGNPASARDELRALTLLARRPKLAARLAKHPPLTSSSSGQDSAAGES